jgi:hypothetical protein
MGSSAEFAGAFSLPAVAGLSAVEGHGGQMTTDQRINELEQHVMKLSELMERIAHIQGATLGVATQAIAVAANQSIAEPTNENNPSSQTN